MKSESNKEIKTEEKKINKFFLNFVCGLIVALIAVGASYSYWHDVNVRVTFYADSEKDIQYQVFYTEDNSARFNEEQSQRLDVPVGSDFIKIVVPAKKIGRFRLDTGVNPGKLTIKDLKISGDKVVKFNDYSKYKYINIKEYIADEGNSLTIVSDHPDPYIITSEELDIQPGDDYDLGKMLLIFGGSFVIAFLLAMLLNRKSSPTEKK